MNRQKIKRIILTLAKTAGVFFLLAVAGFFLFRNYFLHKAIEKVSTRISNSYHAKLHIGEARFTGLGSVELKNISLVPEGYDTLLFISDLQSGVQLGYALLLDIRLKQLVISNGYISLVKDERGTNIDCFVKRDTTAVSSEQQSGKKNSNLARTAYRLISKALNFLPPGISIHDVALKITDSDQHVAFNMQNLELMDKQLTSDIYVNSNTLSQHWHLQGVADPRNKTADVAFYNRDTGKVIIPYVNERFHLVTGFDSIRLKLESVKMDDEVLQIKGLASTTNFLINHPKISKKDVVIDKAEFDYMYVIGSNFISIDSSSTVRFNKITFHPYVMYQRAPDTVFQLSVITENMVAQDFISSLPEGLFTHFQGMEAEGNFDYRLDFIYNENKPQDLVFESRLNKYGLKIIRYGEANLAKLNSDFVYTPIENGRPQRPIFVGLANPNYTTLDQLSPYLPKSVLTTEDPSFFYHRGFIDEAFRQSIIKNIRKRKFARGASTISMQLVKNVFLTREKTLSRKLEEILLVYILENNRLSSKERMFEVYLNIIEWGPNVYGIGEASRFYFEKHPSQLKLNESLFLATIIPRPKGFMWRFGKDGKLKEFAARQFHFLSELMVRRNFILPEDTFGVSTPIEITGPAKGFIKISADTLLPDTMMLLNEDGLLGEQNDDE